MTTDSNANNDVQEAETDGFLASDELINEHNTDPPMDVDSTNPAQDQKIQFQSDLSGPFQKRQHFETTPIQRHQEPIQLHDRICHTTGSPQDVPASTDAHPTTTDDPFADILAALDAATAGLNQTILTTTATNTTTGTGGANPPLTAKPAITTTTGIGCTTPTPTLNLRGGTNGVSGTTPPLTLNLRGGNAKPASVYQADPMLAILMRSILATSKAQLAHAKEQDEKRALAKSTLSLFTPQA